MIPMGQVLWSDRIPWRTVEGVLVDKPHSVNIIKTMNKKSTIKKVKGAQRAAEQERKRLFGGSVPRGGVHKTLKTDKKAIRRDGKNQEKDID